MVLTRSRAIAVLVSVMAVTGYGFQKPQSSPANRPWPPGVQKVSDESPALSPAEALKTFYMPPGYRVELVASEPLDSGPGRDRLGSRGPALGRRDARLHARSAPTPEPNLDPIGRVVVLEDTNRDGTMDKRTVFADGLVLRARGEGAGSRRARRRAAERSG